MSRAFQACENHGDLRKMFLEKKKPFLRKFFGKFGKRIRSIKKLLEIYNRKMNKDLIAI